MSPQQKSEKISQVIGLMNQDQEVRIAFSCHTTEEIGRHATGDGTLIPINFVNCDSDSENSIFTAPRNGTYFINWKIFLEGITIQTEAIIQVQSSNKNYSFPTNNLSALKDQDHIVLTGTALIPVDAADTIKLAVKVGKKGDKQTVALSPSSDAEFSGFLI